MGATRDPRTLTWGARAPACSSIAARRHTYSLQGSDLSAAAQLFPSGAAVVVDQVGAANCVPINPGALSVLLDAGTLRFRDSGSGTLSTNSTQRSAFSRFFSFFSSYWSHPVVEGSPKGALESKGILGSFPFSLGLVFSTSLIFVLAWAWHVSGRP